METLRLNFKIISFEDNNWKCSHSNDEIIRMGSINSEQWNSFEPLFEDEVWKSLSVIGYDNYYASNYGRIYQIEYSYTYNKSGKTVKRTQPARIVRNILMNTGYYSVYIYNEHNKKSLGVHRIIGYLFNPVNRPDNINFNRNEKFNIVDHIDTIKTNNIASNLRWSNFVENFRNSTTLEKMSKIKRNTHPNRSSYSFNNYEGTTNDLISDVVANKSTRWFSLIDFKDEVWKEIDGFSNCYASNYGRVKKPFANKENLIYIPHYTLSTHGYFVVYLNKHPYTVHRIIYSTFNDIDENLVIDHIDTIRTNNCIDNLRQVSRAQNNRNIKSVKKNKIHRTPSTMKPVALYSLVTGEKIGDFRSQEQCAKYLNVVSVIGSTPSKIHIVAYLYIAIFKQYEEEFLEKKLLDKYITKRINQYSLDGKFIKTFDTSFYITDDYKKRKSIFKCCNGKNMSAFNYQWRWYNGSTDDIESILDKIKNHNTRHTKNIEVYSYPDMELLGTYLSSTEICNLYGLNKNYVLRCAKGEKPFIKSSDTNKSYVLKYVDRELENEF